MNLFSNWPELFDEGIICRTLTPLYVCEKKGNTHLFYNKKDYDNFDSKGYEVSYIKGLGTLSKEAYKVCIMEPNYVQVHAGDSGLDTLEMAFGDDADKRKVWMLGT